MNLRDFLEAKDFKDVKYIDAQWKAQMDNDVPVGVQGPLSGRTYFTNLFVIDLVILLNRK